ncbi:hypothetical protein ACFL9S_08750 [Erwinia sp. AnSW2-5]|uniref:hypothetical protein n=1 Tax=Erwinia sp. AnSW2-5 TaxID=3367692 RepID=UPI00385C7AE9
MRELNSTDISNVSGGAFSFSDYGQSLGLAIGNAVSSKVAEAASLLGKGIGNIFECKFIDAVNNMSTGIRGIISWAKSR